MSDIKLSNRNEIINIIKESLLDQVNFLNDSKSILEKDKTLFIKYSRLYDNIIKNKHGFIKEYLKSSDRKKENFIKLLNELYDNKKIVTRIINEMEDMNSLLSRGYKVKLKYFNNLIVDIENKMTSLCISLDLEEIERLDNLINDYIELSYIFGKDKIKSSYNIDKYVELIRLLDIDTNIKLQLIEFGIKELLYVNNNEEINDLEEYDENSYFVPKLDDIILDII